MKIRGERKRGLKLEHVEIKPYHFVKREKNSCIYEAFRKMKKEEVYQLGGKSMESKDRIKYNFIFYYYIYISLKNLLKIKIKIQN